MGHSGSSGILIMLVSVPEKLPEQRRCDEEEEEEEEHEFLGVLTSF